MVESWRPPKTELAASISASATTLTVEDAGDFAAKSTPFPVICGLEMMTVTARGGTTWSLTRAIRGSTAKRHLKGATVSAFPVAIVADSIDFTAIARGLHHRERHPEGEIEALWEFTTRDPTPWLPAIDSVFRLSDTDGTRPIFGGLIERVAIVERKTGWYRVTITGRGYIVTAAWDGYSDSRIFEAQTAAHTIFETTIAEKCPYIRTDTTHIVHGGTAIAQSMEVVGQTPRQIWETLSSMGDIELPLDYAIRTDTDGAPKLWLFRRDGEPLATIPKSSLRGDLGLAWEGDDKKTKVIIKGRDGYLPRTGTGSPTKWVYKDWSSQVDNLDLSEQIAGQILGVAANWGAVGDGQFVVDGPVTVNGVDYEPYRLRAGWLVEIPGLFSASGFPVNDMQIVGLDADHDKRTVTLQLGKLLDEDLDRAAQFTGRQMKQIAPAGGSGVIPNFVTSPDGVPTGMDTGLVASGSSGKIGAAKIADDFDMSTIYFAIPEVDPDTGILVAKTYYKNPVPIDVRMLIRGLRLKATDDDDPPGAAGDLSVTVTRGTAGSYPALGDEVGTINLSGAYENLVNFPEHPTDEHVANHVFHVEPEDYLLVTVNPTPTVFAGATLGILVQRTEGSSRGALTGGPGINTLSASRDANNDVTFLVTTDRVCLLQVEYGMDPSVYGWRTKKTDQLRRVSSLTWSGIPSTAHWRAHVFDTDGTETVSADQAV